MGAERREEEGGRRDEGGGKREEGGGKRKEGGGRIEEERGRSEEKSRPYLGLRLLCLLHLQRLLQVFVARIQRLLVLDELQVFLGNAPLAAGSMRTINRSEMGMAHREGQCSYRRRFDSTSARCMLSIIPQRLEGH